MATLYILRSLRNGSYYIGSTNCFEKRLVNHKSGRSKYTRNLLPLEVVFKQDYKFVKTARKAEYWIKSQKSRLLIEKIVKEGKINRVFN